MLPATEGHGVTNLSTVLSVLSFSSFSSSIVRWKGWLALDFHCSSAEINDRVWGYNADSRRPVDDRITGTPKPSRPSLTDQKLCIGRSRK